MDQHETQPSAGSGRADRDLFAPSIVGLGRASAETCGCMGVFAVVVRHLQPPETDHG
jgi:hypothetical protein